MEKTTHSIPKEKLDRRTRRTQQLLSNALIELMLEKHYDSITVQDIIDRADIGRSTFYAHFRDKEDLFLRDFESLLDDLSRQIDHSTAGSGNFVPSLGFFRHVQESHHLYRALIWGRGIDLLFKTGQSYLSTKIEQELARNAAGKPDTPVPLPVMANYIAGTLLTLIKWWLENNMPYPPETMDEFYKCLVMPGVWAGLGTQPFTEI